MTWRGWNDKIHASRAGSDQSGSLASFRVTSRAIVACKRGARSQRAAMAPAQRRGEFVANLAPQRAQLGDAQTIGVRRRSSADEA